MRMERRLPTDIRVRPEMASLDAAAAARAIAPAAAAAVAPAAAAPAARMKNTGSAIRVVSHYAIPHHATSDQAPLRLVDTGMISA